MADDRLVEKKLNFWQRIRKSLYLRNMDEKKASRYDSLPDYLKQDVDVIDSAFSTNERLINSIPIGSAKEKLKQNPHLLSQYHDIRVLNQVFNESPELIAQYENEGEGVLNNIFTLIYDTRLEGDRTFLKYLSKELQLRILTENIPYKNMLDPPEINQTHGYISWLYEYLKEFSEDAIIALALHDNQIIASRANISIIKEKNRASQFDIKSLSLETQLKLLMISPEFKSEVSEEAVAILTKAQEEEAIKFVNGNPLLFERLPDRIKEQMVTDTPELFAKMPSDFKSEYLETHPDFYKYLTTNINFKLRSFETPEEAIEKIILRGGLRGEEKYSLNMIDDEYVLKIGMLDPETVKLGSALHLNESEIVERERHLIKIFKEHILKIAGPSTLTEYLEYLEHLSLEDRNSELVDYYKTRGKIDRNLLKMILNDDILKAIPGSTILDYMHNPSREKLIDIVKTTYGETSAKILEDRPGIDINLIHNLYLFKPDIVDEFGIGAIHANLSYDMQATSGILSELARKPELMEQYRVYNKWAKDAFPDTAVGLQDKLVSFIKCKELMKHVDFANLNDEQKENLQVAIMDSKRIFEPVVVEFPKTLEELEGYMSQRNMYYDEAIRKETDVYKIKDLISRRFFGLNYDKGWYERQLNSPDVRQMCDFYNLEKFVNNPITLQGRKIYNRRIRCTGVTKHFYTN